MEIHSSVACVFAFIGRKNFYAEDINRTNCIAQLLRRFELVDKPVLYGCPECQNRRSLDAIELTIVDNRLDSLR